VPDRFTRCTEKQQDQTVTTYCVYNHLYQRYDDDNNMHTVGRRRQRLNSFTCILYTVYVQYRPTHIVNGTLAERVPPEIWGCRKNPLPVEKFSPTTQNWELKTIFEKSRSKIKMLSIRNLLCRKFTAVCQKNATSWHATYFLNPQHSCHCDLVAYRSWQKTCHQMYT